MALDLVNCAARNLSWFDTCAVFALGPEPSDGFWINHHLKWLAGFLKCIGKLIGIGDMHVVILFTMNQKQLSMQLPCLLYDRGRCVAGYILLRQSHVSFGVNGIVIAPVGDRAPAIPAQNRSVWVNAYDVK